MKSMAIFVSGGIGKNQGGPSGYVYNLVQGAEKNKKDIKLLAPNIEAGNEKEKPAHSGNKKKFAVLRSLSYIAKCGIISKRRFGKMVKNYDIIHVHSSQDLYYLKRYLGFKGKIVFTPHRPEPYSKELLSAYRLTFGKTDSPRIITLEGDRIEKYSYKYADRFIFPSQHAREIYETFPGFSEYGKNKPTDYLITGTPMKEVTASRLEFRKRLDINEKDFVITYIGRHNKIKGYDLLASIADRLEELGIITVCAGNTKGVDIPDNAKWIELGYINNAPDLMNASDVVVIPNRNTYFDLVIIEALSIGKIVITSNTGGNIDIAKETEGLFLFEAGSSEALLNAIIDVKNMTSEEISRREQAAFDYYQTNCMLTAFADKYCDIMDKIFLDN